MRRESLRTYGTGRPFQQMLVVRKEQHLRIPGQFREHPERGAGRGVVEIDHDVIHHDRHGLLVGDVALDRRQPQRQKKLIPRPRTQVADGFALAIGANTHQDRHILIKIRRHLVEPPAGNGGKQL